MILGAGPYLARGPGSFLEGLQFVVTDCWRTIHPANEFDRINMPCIEGV